jgi:hypothetical protein
MPEKPNQRNQSVSQTGTPGAVKTQPKTETPKGAVSNATNCCGPIQKWWKAVGVNPDSPGIHHPTPVPRGLDEKW